MKGGKSRKESLRSIIRDHTNFREEMGRNFHEIKLDVRGSKVKLVDRHYFLLMLMLKEGPLNRNEIDERAEIFVNQFGFHPGKRRGKWRQKSKEEFNLEKGIDELIGSGMVRALASDRFELTEEGVKLAGVVKDHIERGARQVRRIKDHMLDPLTVAKVTIILDLFLAAMKLFSGLVTGSVALLADGADAAVDTASAFIVWLGIRLKKELMGAIVIVMMMFVTAGSIAFESVSKIIEAVKGILPPVELPLLVIGAETVALIFAVILYLYQHYAGKKNGNLSLISQSVDSRNHIYVALSVIAGAVLSMTGIHFVDAIIGALIAARIGYDGVGLVREVILKTDGEESSLLRRKNVVEKRWHVHKEDTFRNWVLYCMENEGSKTKSEVLDSLNRTFKPVYVPIMSEFDFGVGRNYDFEAHFGKLMRPLLKGDYVVKEGGKYLLTHKGESRIKNTVRTSRFRY